MRESELNLGEFGAPGRKPFIATTNYHLDGLKPRSATEEGTIDQSVLGWPDSEAEACKSCQRELL